MLIEIAETHQTTEYQLFYIVCWGYMHSLSQFYIFTFQ